MRFAIYLVALCVPLGGPATAGEQALPAFPGAEGFGAVAVGGRGGRVIRVTNRKPAGPGSFAAALGAKGPRIIVFDVSGVIPAAGGKYGRYPLGDGHVTIAGQTAPGPGITVEGQLWFRGQTDIIVRHLRVRYAGRAGGDAVNIWNCERVIFDHVSIAWGADESLSLPGTKHATVQWTTIEESRLTWEGGDEPHNFGMIISGGPSTLHHVLFAHHHSRAPAAQYGVVLDYRNSVLYNHGTYLGAPPGGGNVVGNYVKDGPGALFGFPRIYHPPGTLTRPGLGLGRKPGKVYVGGNYLTHAGGYYEPAARARRLKYGPPATKPVRCPPVTTHVAEEAYGEVMAAAGALPRDEITARCIWEVRHRAGLWDTRRPPAGWRERLSGGQPRPDADKDGMPDRWETAHGLDPNDPEDAGKTVPAGASPGDRHEGYTYVEFYVNELADTYEAEALTAARLGPPDRDKPTKPESRPLPKPVDRLVADIAQQTLALHKTARTDTGAAWRAIWALKDAGPNAAPAAKPLATLLDTTDNRTALFAAWALGVIAPHADEDDAVPALVKALERTDYQRRVRNSKWNMNPRGFVAWALGRFGPRAADAVPALARTLHGEDVWARQPAAWALAEIGPKARDATDALARALGDAGGHGWSAKYDCRYHAARALAKIGKPALPTLLERLGSGESRAAVGAAMALGRMGADAREAAPALIKALARGDPFLKAAAAKALAGVAPDGEGVAAALAAELADSDYGTRQSAARALGECGPAAAGALGALRKALNDPRPEVQFAAAEALGKIGKDAVSVLAEVVRSRKDASLRAWCARALGTAAAHEEAATARQALSDALGDRSERVRREAAWALGRLGPRAAGAEAALKKAANDPDHVVRVAAAAALRRVHEDE